MYKNYNAWDEVTATIRKSKELTRITMELYGQETFKGLTNEQRDLVYSKYVPYAQWR